MNDRLYDFYAGLVADPERLRQFLKEPGPLLEAAGFSEAERAILLSGDLQRVHDLIDLGNATV